MIRRFEGEAGRNALIDTLKRSDYVAGDQALATAIADKGKLRALAAGAVLIKENASDSEVFFIVAGELNLSVKGKAIGVRTAGALVGEISAIDPTQLRAASLIAAKESVVVQLSAADFLAIADAFPLLWKAVALGLASRLVQRNALVAGVNEQVNIFIICSVEALDIAQEIQAGLSHENMLVTVWTNGVFIASHYALESLEDALQAADFAVAIAHPDDQTVTRGQTEKTPRDNVIFELGFFMGRLGRRRTLLLEQRGEDIKLPSDLAGITTIGYRVGPPDKLPALLGPVCTEIKKIAFSLGPKQ
ncbi:MAG: cyclic nucleotide-binding domain-containing protein [Mesorhizobium sp.]|uniref:TIR domain-containing protein n=1 Tax=Mesorhizobium sp. TaxID=1871066 RepID=UPI000FE50EBA|nr:TIR domain-containing protein [Mesorhizobium sp.]RWM96183.1 MAG: cyclic nucleotide-binding domain-containing protein [Mesorhizobium sp.]